MQTTIYPPKCVLPLNPTPQMSQRSQTSLADWGCVIPHAPKTLYYQGNLELLKRLPAQGLAVVGTRDPQMRSIQYCQQIIQDLARTELIIVSGLARGIDAAAHWQAIQSGLPTVAVVGCGLSIDYPKENKELRECILKSGGLILSEYPHSTPARGYQFLHRNRLIAALSSAVWVVQAPRRSGALNTAKWARDLNRTCFATPCFPSDPALAGNQILLDRDHALNLYGAHSLGAVWIELAARKNNQAIEKR